MTSTPTRDHEREYRLSGTDYGRHCSEARQIRDVTASVLSWKRQHSESDDEIKEIPSESIAVILSHRDFHRYTRKEMTGRILIVSSITRSSIRSGHRPLVATPHCELYIISESCIVILREGRDVVDEFIEEPGPAGVPSFHISIGGGTGDIDGIIYSVGAGGRVGAAAFNIIVLGGAAGTHAMATCEWDKSRAF